MNKYSEFYRGVFDTSPLVLAAVPFGIIFGALAISIGLSPLVTILMSLFVFAGASQFIAISLFASGSSLTVILLAVFFVNLRHMLYSINLMPHVYEFSQKYRILMAFWLTDETFAVVSKFIEKKRFKSEFMFYYFGSSLTMYIVWAICTAIGIFLGRIANFINGELYGKVTILPWGVIFPNAGNAPRHPSQIYEAMLEGVILFLIINYLALKKELLYKTGYVSAIFLIFYSIFRIFSESFREPDIQLGLLFNYFSMGTILSLLTIIFGLFVILSIKKNE